MSEYTSATDMTFERGRQDVLKNGDGFHTFDELYEFRMVYHAALVHAWRDLSLWESAPKTVKSWRHSDGEECFGGGWFIVVTTLWPGAQISNHYEAKHWDLFDCREVARPPKFDGHTPGDVIERLREYLKDD